jgi:hypothetical protein
MAIVTPVRPSLDTIADAVVSDATAQAIAALTAQVAELQAKLANATVATPRKTTAKQAKPAVKLTKMTAKREKDIHAQLTKLWHERVALRKKSGRDAEYKSGLIAQMDALKAELKAAGKDSRPRW